MYTQGYKDEALTNFTLSLTTPSIIYDQEKIALLKEKVALSKDIMDSKLLPTDWIYDHVFHFSDNEFDDYRDLIREDAKRAFRLQQIENEGNDPLESGKSYGTPHDLASLYGKGRYSANSENVPSGYDEKEPLGRPKEKASNINTQDNAFGKDRLGNRGMNVDDQEKGTNLNFKGGSPLALENNSKIEYLKNKHILENLSKGKKLIFESENNESFLDENQLRS